MTELRLTDKSGSVTKLEGVVGRAWIRRQGWLAHQGNAIHFGENGSVRRI